MYLGPLPEANSSGEVQVRSCFRHDPNPSMFINLEDGRYNDFGSDYKGDAYNFYIHMHDASFTAAKKAVDEIVGSPEEGNIRVPVPIDEDLVLRWHSNLMASDDLRKYMNVNRGISNDILKKFKIGFDGQRYTIPIYNKYGVCVNVRRYSPGASGGDKMINYGKGYGNARLFPLEALESKVVLLQEGEFDTLIQWSKGFKAITNTSGAATWKQEWTELFKGKIVYICYDADKAGKEGAIKVASQLIGVAERVCIIDLPVPPNSGEDVTDYYVKYDKTAEEFAHLMSEAKPFQLDDGSADAQANTVTRTTLVEARHSRFKHKKVQFDVMVVGKDTAPYNIPSQILFKCSMVGVNEKMCSACQIARCGGELELQIPKDPDMLELIKSSKQQQMGLLKRKAGIPQNCSFYQAEDTKSVNIEEVLLAPEIQSFSEWSPEGVKYILQSAFIVDHPLDANRTYRVTGIMTPDPWQQHVTFLLTDGEPLQDTVSSFRMTPELYQQLKIFQVTESVEKKFEEIHEDFEANVTHIVGRRDLLTGIDLTYHSVLSFFFQEVPIHKGWLDFLCIGDTRTGKSETTEKLLRHYQLGEISVAENTSYAGLVGGLQQTGDRRWFLTWGKLPLNDGRLFVIDEVSGMSVDDIGKMSGIRSSGIAELTKIQTERTTARTRLIWLSNPRSGRNLSTYSYGVLAVPELIGRAEDISRFDFVVAASRDEVPIDLINQRKIGGKEVPHRFTSALCRALALWAWSRKAEDVVFEDSATDAILHYAIKMGREYSSAIPLVEGANQRIKLARLAVAAAARVFSTDSTGEKVIVKKEHVDFVYAYLEQIYSKPSLDYKGYSERELADIRLAEKYRDEVTKYLEAFPDIADLFDRQEYVWPKHLEEQLGCERAAAQEHIAFFTRTRMIQESNSRGYRKSAAFIQILREWKFKRKVEEELH